MSESDTKSRVNAIQSLKDKIKQETEAIGKIKQQLKEVQDKQTTEREVSASSVMEIMNIGRAKGIENIDLHVFDILFSGKSYASNSLEGKSGTKKEDCSK